MKALTIKIDNLELNVLPETAEILKSKGFNVIIVSEVSKNDFYRQDRLLHGLDLAKKQSGRSHLNLAIDCADLRSSSEVMKNSNSMDKWISKQKVTKISSKDWFLNKSMLIKSANKTL